MNYRIFRAGIQDGDLAGNSDLLVGFPAPEGFGLIPF